MSLSARRPRVLWESVQAGAVPADDLPELIAFAWLRDDEPTSDLNDLDWIQIFAQTGFFSFPAGRSQPTAPTTLYRGATTARIRRMSWAEDHDVAKVLGTRHAWHAPAALYSATVEPDAILALLGRPGEGWTVVVNPAMLGRITVLENLPDPRPAS
jgi:hypothetical protein